MNNEQNIDVNTNNVQAPQAPEQQEQKLFTTEEVDGLIRHKVERTRAHLEAEYAKKLKAAEVVPVAQPVTSSGVDVDSIAGEIERRLEAKYKEREEQRLDQEAQQTRNMIANEYRSKLEATRDANEYEDFHDVMSKVNHQAYEYLVWGANQLPNTADVVYDLFKNHRREAWQLQQMAPHDPEGFLDILKQHSERIAQSKEARNNLSKAPMPLAQVKSGAIGAAKSDDSYESLKKKYTF